jgi:hypothetical protein
MRCPCGRCRISGEDAIVRRAIATTAIICQGCGRMLTAVALPTSPIVFLVIEKDSRALN